MGDHLVAAGYPADQLRPSYQIPQGITPKKSSSTTDLEQFVKGEEVSRMHLPKCVCILITTSISIDGLICEPLGWRFGVYKCSIFKAYKLAQIYVVRTFSGNF
jgi:hypothetical protein